MVITYSIKKIQIETCNLCNFDCKICPREKLNINRKVMDYNLFKIILRKISGVKYLDLTGWGEPLLNPKIIKMIKDAKKESFYISFTTNAYLLYKKKSKNLRESGVDEICFSIDSLKRIKESDHFGKPIKNIINFMKSHPNLKTRIQTVLLDEDIEKYEKIMDFAAENRIDKVRLVRLDNYFANKKNFISRTKERKIFIYLLKYARKKKVNLEMAQYRWGKFPMNVFTEMAQNTFFKNYCPKLVFACYVNNEGKVTPCCNLPHLIMGDLEKENLSVIWKNNKFINFRKNYRDYCKDCEILTV